MGMIIGGIVYLVLPTLAVIGVTIWIWRNKKRNK